MLNDLQKQQLLAPLDANRVLTKDGQSHLAVWDVRRWLNRIFGPAGWSGEVLECTLVYESDVTIGQGKKPGYEVGYRCTYRLTIHDPGADKSLAIGAPAVYTEVAFGDAKMGVTNRGQIHDFAIKTAESQALKRCAINLGDQFGLSLYDHGGREDVDNPGKVRAVVIRALAWETPESLKKKKEEGEQNTGIEHDDGEINTAEELQPPVDTDTGEIIDHAEPDHTVEEIQAAADDADDGTADREKALLGLRDALLEAGNMTDKKARRAQVAKLSLEMGNLKCEKDQVPGYDMTFGLLRDQAMVRVTA